MEKRFKPDDRIIYVWVEKNYWRETGQTKATAHPVENRNAGRFVKYVGSKKAEVLLNGKRGGMPVRRTVKLANLVLESEAPEPGSPQAEGQPASP
jgi:hypothetical protein